MPSINCQPLIMPAWPCPTLQHPSNQRWLCHCSNRCSWKWTALEIYPQAPSHCCRRRHHQQYQTNLWRLASHVELSPDWTTGSPVAPHTAVCKFLCTNKQPVVRGGWPSRRACVLVCVCGWGGWKRGRLLGLQQTRSRGPQCPASYSDEGSPVYEPVGSLKLLRCRQCH